MMGCIKEIYEMITRKRVLVCGATGFIGRNVAESLGERDDCEVTGTYFQSEPVIVGDVEMVHANLLIPDDVQKVVAGKDVILQYAAVTSGSKDIVTAPHIHVTDNAVMNSLLLRAAFDNNVGHFLFPSCAVMYQPSEVPLKEDDFNPSEEMLPSYFGIGNTKVYIEKMCEFFSRLGKTRHTVLRQANVYGPHDKFDLEKSHVFGATMTKVMNTPDGGTIQVWGDGKEARDFLHVGDLVNLIERSIDRQQSPFELYTAGSGEAVPVRELVRKMIEASGKRLEIQYDASQPTIKTSLCLDSTKAKGDFGWTPGIGLDDGIGKTMAWYQENVA